MESLALKAQLEQRPLDHKSVRALLSGDGPLLAVLSQLALQAQRMAEGLQGCDLGSDEGRLKAIRMQGTVEGIRRCVEMFLDFGKMEEENVGTD